MSWDAELVDDRGHGEGCWNYTHNTNGMIAAALVAAGLGETPLCGGPVGPVIGPIWWDRLAGMTGPDGASMLQAVVDQLEATPDVYDLMNPPNGWGSRAGLVEMLRSMIAAVPSWPTVWHTSG